jgi:hypothetical protein
MARVKGGLFTGMLDVNKRFPLDSRMLVAKREDLINPATWITNTLTTESTYNVMIVSVNSDGEHNGVYYLLDRKAITADNYSAYKTALGSGQDVNPYFSMWMKLGTLADIETVEKNLKDLIGKIKPTINLVPIDGTIIINDAENGDKSIGVVIAPVANNALTAIDGGLFVPVAPIQTVDTTHGLVAVDGALTINLATKDSDGAMSKEDKAFIDSIPDVYATSEEVKALKDAVSALENSCIWGEM